MDRQVSHWPNFARSAVECGGHAAAFCSDRDDRVILAASVNGGGMAAALQVKRVIARFQSAKRARLASGDARAFWLKAYSGSVK